MTEEFFDMVVRIKMRTWITTLLVVIPFAGCASFQDIHYEHAQKYRTEKAYWHFKWTSEEPVGTDYAKGWKAGYLDVLTGGDGQPPVVPPKRYWSASRKLKYGEQPRNDWYIGYQDGAMMASLEPDTHYIKAWNTATKAQMAEHQSIPQALTIYPAHEHQVEPAKVPPSESPVLTPEGSSRGVWESFDPTSNPNLPPVPEKPSPIFQ